MHKMKNWCKSNLALSGPHMLLADDEKPVGREIQTLNQRRLGVGLALAVWTQWKRKKLDIAHISILFNALSGCHFPF